MERREIGAIYMWNIGLYTISASTNGSIISSLYRYVEREGKKKREKENVWSQLFLASYCAAGFSFSFFALQGQEYNIADKYKSGRF